MKIVRTMMTLAFLLGACVMVRADEMKMAAPKPNPAFDQIKGLAGNWEGQASDGKTAKISYQVVASGNVVMETLDAADHSSMITMYHVDGGKLVMDHYCAMPNVPHMRGTLSADGKQIDFAFVSASNLSGPNDAHMHGLKVTFVDPTHFTQEWSMRAEGKTTPVVFKFQKVG